MDMAHFVYSFIYMGIVNITIMNIYAQVFVSVFVFNYFEFILRSKIPRLYEKQCLNSTF